MDHLVNTTEGISYLLKKNFKVGPNWYLPYLQIVVSLQFKNRLASPGHMREPSIWYIYGC